MYNVNFAKSEHIELISELEQINFGAEAYSKDTINDMLKDNYLLKNNDNIFEIYNEDELIGYIIFHINDDFTDIYKIFVTEKNRKMGYGKALIDKVYELAKRLHSKKLMIEVRKNNNTAINFYIKNGFKEISIRNCYYKNPNDDALIFEKEI